MPVMPARKFCAAIVLLACSFAPLPTLRAADTPAATDKPAATEKPDIVIPPAGPISADDSNFFEAHIRPVLVNECYKCHSHDADKIKGGLMLDTREGVLHGGDTGPAIVPGKPDDSLLIKAIR